MSFFRKHVRGLLRQTFSNGVKSPGSSDEDTDGVDEFGADGRQKNQLPVDYADSSLIYERILNGRNGRKVELPEIYSGKTGLDLPVIQLDSLSPSIRAAYTGPDGGLTNVQQIRQQPIVKMATLDDELSLSMGSEDEFEEHANGRREIHGSLESLGFCNGDLEPSSLIDRLDWNDAEEERAFGISISLYEKHPISGLQAGLPIADVFAVLARQNNAILALADGVNWGEGSRLAARCAIRGAVDHLNASISSGKLRTTTDVFHDLLGAFHSAHALILQEGGALTTLCVALIVPVKNSDSFALCVCNVGDSLCFVQNEAYGVREVTLASHEIDCHRNMRDAGGALGPVDGRNAQLHNLTCSMTFVETGDMVFITSDGVSDNFDPVVGKFCIIKRNENDEKENDDGSPTIPNSASAKQLHKTKSMPNGVPKQKKRCVAVLPCVDAAERQELMLLRMSDVIGNGIANLAQAFSGFENDESSLTPPVGPRGKPPTTASSLCRNLVDFAYHLSNAKRRTLEDPELYRTRTPSKTEERLRRKVIRAMIMEMPGKLDHASVVAFRVGSWDYRSRETPSITKLPLLSKSSTDTMKQNEEIVPPIPTTSPPPLYQQRTSTSEFNCLVRITRPSAIQTAHTTVVQNQKEVGKLHLCLDIPPELGVEDPSPLMCRKSPYEEQPIAPNISSATSSPLKVPLRKNVEENGAAQRYKQRKHKRGSALRHTLGVDITWIKNAIINRHFSANQNDNKTPNHPSGSTNTVDDLGSTSTSMSGTPSDSQNLPSPSTHCSSSYLQNKPKPLHHSASTGVAHHLPPNGQRPTRLHATASSNSSSNFSLRKLKHMIRPSQPPVTRFNPRTDTQL
ncbi:Protein phosphatase 2C (PP2C)-like domain-containing protein [Aphelenchoides besseyi]|nr:Protein phosphatase 2C (PP2C)-like domain-containing protein [Aphelenchoides besseyi]KAI6194720.1 Protein phosphatase 2C (PP2C)-like domain-containing protein [Aphelenchoides besseyi]